jgi:hypothetical protein
MLHTAIQYTKRIKWDPCFTAAGIMSQKLSSTINLLCNLANAEKMPDQIKLYFLNIGE